MKYEDDIFTLTRDDCRALVSSTAPAMPNFSGKLRFTTSVHQLGSIARVVATDARTLVTVTTVISEPNDELSFSIPAGLFYDIVKKMTRKRDTLQVSFFSAQPVVQNDGYGTKQFVTIEAIRPDEFEFLASVSYEIPDDDYYPDTSQLIPPNSTDGPNFASIAFNPELLKRALLVATACNQSTEKLVWHFGETNEQPIKLVCHNKATATKWVCVVMPMDTKDQS